MKCDEPLSSLAYNFDLRHCISGTTIPGGFTLRIEKFNFLVG